MHTRFLQYNLQILRSGELKTLGVHTRGTCRPLQPLQIAESADVIVTKLQIGSSRVARIFVRSRRVSAGKLLDDRAAARVVTEVGGRVKYAASDDDPASKLRGVLADNAPAGLVVIGCTAAAAARGLHSSLAGRPPPLASAVGGLEPLVLRRGRQNRRGSMLLILQRT